jgi:hypothetical protein
MKSLLIATAALSAVCGLALAETKTDQTASVTIDGKKITIAYSSPAVNHREGRLFGKDGKISQDPTYPVWRAGANAATALQTDADLKIGSLTVPKGSYTLYVNIADAANWVLIVNKQTGQGGTTYDAKQDLGRVKMTMSKPASTVEQLQYSLSSTGAHQGKLYLTWEKVDASVTFTVK